MSQEKKNDVLCNKKWIKTSRNKIDSTCQKFLMPGITLKFYTSLSEIYTFNTS